MILVSCYDNVPHKLCSLATYVLLQTQPELNAEFGQRKTPNTVAYLQLSTHLFLGPDVGQEPIKFIAKMFVS